MFAQKLASVVTTAPYSSSCDHSLGHRMTVTLGHGCLVRAIQQLWPRAGADVCGGAKAAEVHRVENKAP